MTVTVHRTILVSDKQRWLTWWRARCDCGWRSYWRGCEADAAREADHHTRTER